MSDRSGKSKDGLSRADIAQAVIALAGIFGMIFGLAQAGVSEQWEIGVLVGIAAVAVVGFSLYRWPTWAAILWGVAVLVAFAGFAVGNTDSSTGRSGGREASPRYAARLSERLGDLRQALAQASSDWASVTGDKLYADRAQQISRAFVRASSTIAQIRPLRADRRRHARLVRMLRGVGEAYDRLAAAVVDPEAGQQRVDAARGALQTVERDLIHAIAVFKFSGYRIDLPPGAPAVAAR